MVVVAYCYKADVYCPDCVVEEVCRDAGIEPFDYLDAEIALDKIAEESVYCDNKWGGLDRYDEHTFDSDEFPKVVFSTSCNELEYCCICHGEI
jgi:hypothetical protein